MAQNVLTYGTGALNIDACRVEGEPWKAHDATGLASVKFFTAGDAPVIHKEPHAAGRWPANVVLDESQAAALDEQSGESVSKAGGSSGTHFSAGSPGVPTPDRPRGGHNDSGGASRFFYTTKATSAERPRYTRPKLRLRGGLTPEQVDHVRARLAEAGVQVD